MAYCEKCGEQISKNAQFCRKCGQRVEELPRIPIRPPRAPKAPPPSPPPRVKKAKLDKAISKKDIEKKDKEARKEGPSNNIPKIGATGALISAFGAFILGIVLTIVHFDDSSLLRMLLTSSTLLIGIGCAMAGIGFFGFFKYQEQTLGLASFVIAEFTVIFWIILSVIIANAENLGGSGRDMFIRILMLCLFFSGVMLIFQGLTVRYSKAPREKTILVQLQSTISILAGAACASIVLVIVIGLGLYLWTLAYLLLIPIFLLKDSEDEDDSDEFAI